MRSIPVEVRIHMTERAKLIKQAASFPKGSPERKSVLASITKMAASTIPYRELPLAQQNLCKIIGFKVAQTFEGIHGYVVVFNVDSNNRVGKDELKMWVNNAVFRWLDINSDGTISVGM